MLNLGDAIQLEINGGVEFKGNRLIRVGYSARADIVSDRRESVLSINEKVL